MLSTLLYILHTHDRTPTHPSNSISKFADNTTVVGLFSRGDEWDEVEQLCVWCRDNNLVIKTSTTKELVVDCRRNKADVQPLYISGDCVERVAAFKFLGILQDLGHPRNTFFGLLPSGKRYRTLKTRTDRLKNSFIQEP